MMQTAVTWRGWMLARTDQGAGPEAEIAGAEAEIAGAEAEIAGVCVTKVATSNAASCVAAGFFMTEVAAGLFVAAGFFMTEVAAGLLLTEVVDATMAARVCETEVVEPEKAEAMVAEVTPVRLAALAAMVFGAMQMLGEMTQDKRDGVRAKDCDMQG